VIDNATYRQVIPVYETFNIRNDECRECPFYDEECSGDGDKRCLCDDVRELLLRGSSLEYLIEWYMKLEALVKDYIEHHKITCDESIYQMDQPQVDAIDLVAKLCKMVGYYEYDEENCE
jgi:hypothetical protein